jgi:hypothetical protein
MLARSKVECQLLAELWLHIAATFRRSGQLDQAFAAIQEAEVANAENAEVWVQVCILAVSLHVLANAVRTAPAWAIP